MNKFTKVSGYKIYKHFTHTQKRNLKGKFKKLFTVPSKRIKYLGTYLTKDVKDLCTENSKTLLKN